MTRDGAAAARVAHNHEVPGSSPGPATKLILNRDSSNHESLFLFCGISALELLFCYDECMQEKLVLSLDIGGTNIDGALISHYGDIIGEVQNMPSVSGQDYDTAIAALLHFIQTVRSQTDAAIAACGIGMPGPFDYTNGISHMEHKFQSLNGKNIKEPLEANLGMPVYFLNDAAAFALGAYWKQADGASSIIGITIGTGLGSGFVHNNRIVTDEHTVPPYGAIWDLPHHDGILEGYVSGRGIAALYENRTGKALSPKDIEDLAHQGDQAALNTYRQMGGALGEGLAAACEHFVPERVIIGGKIGRAATLFLDDAARTFQAKTGYQTVFTQAATELLSLYGPAKYALAEADSKG
jgi:glucokinase